MRQKRAINILLYYHYFIARIRFKIYYIVYYVLLLVVRRHKLRFIIIIVILSFSFL